MNEWLSDFLHAAVVLAVPILLAVLGETLVESAGILNLSLEGMLLSGAFGGAFGARAFGSAEAGVLLGVACALLLASLFAWLVLVARADQVVAGTAVNLLAMGLTAVFWRASYGALGAANDPAPGLDDVAIPLLSDLPIVGRGLFRQHALAYAAYAAAPLLWLYLRRSGAGLRLRACGEAPEAARAMGIPVLRLRAGAIGACAVLAGLGGAALSLADAKTFVDNLSSGRGFVAIALVIFGAHHPLGATAAALLFGGALALQFRFQAAGWSVPPEAFRVLPYVLSLAVLAGFAGKRRAPAALGR